MHEPEDAIAADAPVAEPQPGPGTAPLVSVVMPTYDVGLWIDECLTSVLEDQDVDLEVIVVDDGSHDDTWRRVTQRAATDPRVRPFRSPGVGGGQARNFGVEVARGRYLAFVDGDDLVPRGAYAAMLAAIEASGSDLVVGDFLKFSALQTWSPTERWKGFAERSTGVTLEDHASLVRNRACWNRLFRADFWRESGIVFPSVPRSNDIVPMVSALVTARRIDVVPDLVYLYRERPGGTSMTSQSSSEDAVVSYLSQELLCAQLVGALDGESVDATYWPMVLDADGWVHLRRFVRGRDCDVSPDEPSQVPDLLRELLERRRLRSWSRIRPDKQVVYALACAGRAVWARQVLDASGDEHRPVVEMDPYEALRAAIEVHATGLVEDAPLRSFVYTHVVEVVASRDEPLGPDEAARLAALAQRHAAWFAEPMASIERPQDTRVRRALATGDLDVLTSVAVNRAAVEVTSMVVRSLAVFLVLDLPASTLDAGAVTVCAYKPGRPETLRGVARARFDAGAWRVRVLSTAFPSEGTWALEVALGDDSPVQVPLVVPRAEIRVLASRFGRLTVRGKDTGTVPVTVFRRPPLVRRVARAVRRRLR